MATSSLTQSEGKRRVGRPKTTGRRDGVVAVKGTTEWKAWLDDLADDCRLGLAGVIDLALERLAVEQGFRKPPKRL